MSALMPMLPKIVGTAGPAGWYIVLMIAIFLLLTDSTLLNTIVGSYKEFCEICFVAGAVLISFCNILAIQMLSAMAILIVMSAADWPWGWHSDEEELDGICDVDDPGVITKNHKISTE